MPSYVEADATGFLVDGWETIRANKSEHINLEQDDIRGDAVVRHDGGDLVPHPLLEGGAARIAVSGRCYCQYMTRFESTLYSVYLMQ